ncbi:MAG: hypothetical protein AB2A00_41775 [Myxococcota bacterium]
MLRPRHVAAGLLLALTFVLAPNLRAHGQFPLPLGTLPRVDGSDPLAVATFGILIPAGDEPGYTWVCEEIAGGGASSPVEWARTSEGTLMATSIEGVFRFSPSLCGIQRPVGEVAFAQARSLATHPTRPLVAVGLTSGAVHLSDDDGRTFVPTLARDGYSPVSILLDDDAGMPRVVVLWRKLLDGSVELELFRNNVPTLVPITEPGSTVWRLIAHDVAHPGEVYVRENGEAQDRLLRVRLSDGTATKVLREAGDELTLAVSDDGQRVALGGLNTPLSVSHDAGETFETRNTLKQVRGLRFAPGTRLYAAANNWGDGFAFGVSDDDGQTWRGMGVFADIRGVHECPGEGPGCALGADGCVSGGGNDVLATCAPYWPALKELFGIGRDAGTPPATTDAGPGDEMEKPGGCPALPLPSLAVMGVMGVMLRRVRRGA